MCRHGCAQRTPCLASTSSSAAFCCLKISMLFVMRLQLRLRRPAQAALARVKQCVWRAGAHSIISSSAASRQTARCDYRQCCWVPMLMGTEVAAIIAGTRSTVSAIACYHLHHCPVPTCAAAVGCRRRDWLLHRPGRRQHALLSQRQRPGEVLGCSRRCGWHTLAD